MDMAKFLFLGLEKQAHNQHPMTQQLMRISERQMWAWPAAKKEPCGKTGNQLVPAEANSNRDQTPPLYPIRSEHYSTITTATDGELHRCHGTYAATGGDCQLDRPMSSCDIFGSVGQDAMKIENHHPCLLRTSEVRTKLHNSCNFAPKNKDLNRNETNNFQVSAFDSFIWSVKQIFFFRKHRPSHA